MTLPILRWTGRTWDPVPSGTTDTLSSVWGTDANNIWTVGRAEKGSGFSARWDGTSVMPIPTTGGLSALWGLDSQRVWAVGGGGRIVKWSGTVWTPQASNVASGLPGIWGLDANNIWAAGDSGTILNGDCDPPIRAYTDPWMAVSCQLPARPSQVMSTFRTRPATLT